MATFSIVETTLPAPIVARRPKIVEPREDGPEGTDKQIDGITDDDILDILVDDNTLRERESHFNRPLELLPLIEREAIKDMKWLVVNDAHDCIRDRNCTLKPLTVFLCRFNLGGKETIHICFPATCKHLGGPSHKCGAPENCPHRFAYAARDVFKYDALYLCDRVGRIHLCGKHCRSKFTDLARGGLHTCPLTGIVLQSQLEGPMDNYQRQIMGGDGDALEDDTHLLEESGGDPALALMAAPESRHKRIVPGTLLLLGAGLGSGEFTEEDLQQQMGEWEKMACEVINDVMTTTKMSPMQVIAPVLELLTALKAKKQIAAVENGDISIVDMVSRVYKAMPAPHKIHPAWRGGGDNPLKLPPPINKDNIRRWKRINQIFGVGAAAVGKRESIVRADLLAKQTVESYLIYARKCIEINGKIGYSFKQLMPYIIYQMRHGLSVPLYTPKIGVKHSTVPVICIIPKVELMDHLPPAELFEKYTSVKKYGLNARTLSRMQKISTLIIEMYHVVG
jgi:hypothetical protein